jgi:Flp pilus assembly pilin Flp
MEKGLLAAIVAGLLVIGFVGVVPTLAQQSQAQTDATTPPVTSDTATNTHDNCAF